MEKYRYRKSIEKTTMRSKETVQLFMFTFFTVNDDTPF